MYKSLTKVALSDSLQRVILSKALKEQNVPVFFPKFFHSTRSHALRSPAPSFTHLRGAGGIIVWILATQSGPQPLSPSASSCHSLPSLSPGSPYSSSSLYLSVQPTHSLHFFLNGWSLPLWCHFLFGRTWQRT